jgi:hypothetical protein
MFSLTLTITMFLISYKKLWEKLLSARDGVYSPTGLRTPRVNRMSAMSS